MIKCDCAHETHFAFGSLPGTWLQAHKPHVWFNEEFLTIIQTPNGPLTVCKNCAKHCFINGLYEFEVNQD